MLVGIFPRRAAAIIIVSVALALTACAGPRPASLSSPLSSPSPTPSASVASVVVPNVTGKSGVEAQQTLVEAGFVVEFDSGSKTTAVESTWTVDRQIPTPGTTLAKGATVVLAVSTPAPPPAAPVEQPKAPAPAPKQEAPAPAQKREEPAPAPKQQAPAAPSASYANCSEARAAGAAPIHRGEPGYSKKLDRDGDGIACE